MSTFYKLLAGGLILGICIALIPLLWNWQRVYRIEQLPFEVIPVADPPTGSQFRTLNKTYSIDDNKLQELVSLYPKIPSVVLIELLTNPNSIYDLDNHTTVELKNSSVPTLYKGFFSFEHSGNKYRLEYDYKARRKPWIIYRDKLYYMYAPMTDTGALPPSKHGYHIVELK